MNARGLWTTLACALVCGGLVACGKGAAGAPAAKPAPAKPASAHIAAAALEPKKDPRDHVVVRVTQVVGDVRVGSVTLARGAEIQAGDIVVTAAGGSVTLDLPGEVRLVLKPDSRLARDVVVPALFCLDRGDVDFGAAAVGQSVRVPLLIATRFGATMVAGSAQGSLHVEPAGRAVTVLSGTVRVDGSETTPKSSELGAGQSLRIERTKGRGKNALSQADALVEARRVLDAAWASEADQRTTSQRLATEQREAMKADPARARALQKEIVVQSLVLRAKEEAVLHAWEWVLARKLASTPADDAHLTRLEGIGPEEESRLVRSARTP